MKGITLRGLATRKVRSILTAVAVILGVAMIAGTFVLTDTIGRAFDDIFAQAGRGTDVAVTPRQVVKQDFSEQAVLSEGLLARVKSTPGVRVASGKLFQPGSIRDKNGHPVTMAGIPNFITSAQTAPFGQFTPDSGHLPSAAGEVAIDARTATVKGFKVGDEITISAQAPAKRYRVVGVVRFGNVTSLAGASVALMTLPEAQRMTGRVGELNEINVAAAPGTSPQQLKANLRTALPASVVVRTGAEQATQTSREISSSFSFLRTALLAFGGIALFVGAFIIYNTFSITVAQRARELALLRTLGASRRQVLGSVALEALVIGVLASLAGLGAGLLLAPGLNGLFKALGADLPQTGMVVAPRTIIVSLLVGVLITMLASLVPALRATRVPPLAAMRDGVIPRRPGHARLRGAAAGLLLALGGLLAGLGLGVGGSGGVVAGQLGAGAVLIILAVALFGPWLVRPLASLVGRPLERIGGLPGRLARENANRNPARTAVTAAALMIGLSLVAFVAIFAAGAKQSVSTAIDRSVRGELIVGHEDGFGLLPTRAAETAARVPGVKTVSEVRFAQARVAGVPGNTNVAGVDPATVGELYRFDWKDGSPATLGQLGPGTALVEKRWGDDHGVRSGQVVRLTTPTGHQATYRVVGSFRDRGGMLARGLVVPDTVVASDFGVREDQYAFVRLNQGASAPAVRAAMTRALAAQFPTAKVQTHQQLKDQQAQSLDQLLALVYVLLSLSVIVSLFGIVNTLVLSIHERTRELGMLRAIGASRRQVRRIVRLEAVITALIGAVLGLALGVVFAVVVGRYLAEDGFALSFPFGTLATMLVLAAVAGVIAAIPPARRASRLDVLKALAYE